MSLLVSIVKSSDSVNVTKSSQSFEMQGGTIGRGADNSWVLQDPERYLSACHCQISYENGQYFITDLSTNGTFYNGSPNPIGQGAKLPLHDGDNFMVGDYEFSVSSEASAQSQPANFSDDPFAASGLSSPFSDGSDFGSGLESSSDPFVSAHVSASDSLFSANMSESDPLAALDRAQGKQDKEADFFNNAADLSPSIASANPFAEPTFSDQADLINQQISWPEAVQEQGTAETGSIPDDWDSDFNESPDPFPSAAPVVQSMPQTTPPVVPRPGQGSAQKPAFQADGKDSFQVGHSVVNAAAPAAELPQQSNVQENAKIQAELDLLRQQVNVQQRVKSHNVTVDTSLIDSLGLQKHQLNDDEIVKINQLVGDVVREMLSGLMQVLGSRGSIKNEFRMHVTTIQSVENNPIKFSANVDDALENMFIKQGNSYKKPVEAVREGFDSVAEHQVAILAGIKSAFKGVIERFDPALLEERFSKQNKGGIIPGSHKAKNWNLYHQYFNELAGDIDNSFHFLFGDDFVRAYEEQLQKMAIDKKARKSTMNN